MPSNNAAGSEREAFEAWANAKGTMGNSWNGECYDNILHESAWQAWQAARAAAPPNDAPSRDTCPKCKSGDPKIMLVAHSFRYGRWREIDELSCDPGRIDCNSWHNAPPVADSGASAGEEK